MWNSYRSEDEIGFQGNVSVVELQASFKEIANRMATHIFAVFSWSDADEGMVDAGRESFWNEGCKRVEVSTITVSNFLEVETSYGL